MKRVGLHEGLDLGRYLVPLAGERRELLGQDRDHDPRMAHDPATRAYAERRKAEGKSGREIRRCLERYLARHLYRTLNALHREAAILA